MATPYQKIAKSALMNWNGLSEEEADRKIHDESIQELESQVYAMGSIKYAIIGIAKQLGLSKEDSVELSEAVINGPEDAQIFSSVSEKAKGFSEEQKLGVLSTIHDGWVKDNSSEKTFNKKVDRRQLRQYAPLELIGWNEAKSDLLFLTPILESIGVEVDEQKLGEAYHKQSKDYLKTQKINSKKDLLSLVSTGREYYPALPEELEARLLPKSEDIAEQIIENWNNKDPETAKAFEKREIDSI